MHTYLSLTVARQESEMDTEGVLPFAVDDPLLTAAEAAEVLGVSRWWFGELVRRGRVGPCARIAGRLRVRRSVLDRYRAEQAGDPEDPYLTYKDIGAYLGVSSWTAGELVRRGLLTGTRVGRRVVVRRSAVEAYVEACTK
ncbi:helix-turn-helix domain-containing protein [Promicromonospora sp. NPDC050249]|uniref:helix-turn-helix domain-containing protein n=1 Tax=Promicromonospora sp. NPDC050249 TaxID=3154743 RepID=UPI0033E16053